MTWEVLGAKMGQVPMLFGLRDIPVENVKRQAESCSDLTKIKGKTKAAKCSGGQITIEI